MTITLGLSEILVGKASPEGVMPQIATMKKIGMTYKGTTLISQEKGEEIQHFEEGVSAPAIRKVLKKAPKVTFSIMNADVDTLVDYVGGKKIVKGGSETKTKWSFKGNETVENKAILIKPEQGLCFEIPNGAIEATINGKMTTEGIFLVDFTVTPLDVKNGGCINAYDPKEA